MESRGPVVPSLGGGSGAAGFSPAVAYLVGGWDAGGVLECGVVKSFVFFLTALPYIQPSPLQRYLGTEPCASPGDRGRMDGVLDSPLPDGSNAGGGRERDREGPYRHNDMLVVAAADALDDPQDHRRNRKQAEADLI